MISSLRRSAASNFESLPCWFDSLSCPKETWFFTCDDVCLSFVGADSISARPQDATGGYGIRPYHETFLSFMS